MKNINHSSRKRFATLAAGLLSLLAKADGILIIIVVILGLALGGWYVYHVITRAIPKAITPQDTNEVAFYTVYDTGGEDIVNTASNAPAFFSPPPSGAFSFQYGMCSTNPDPVIWTQVGTNLVGTNPFPSNNITAPEGVLWTLQDTTDTLDVIYYVRNLLYRSTYVQTNGNQTVYDDNLTFVVSKATPPLFSPWQPIYTNDQPMMDYPYTFTDTNATDPAALYRVIGQ